MIGERPQFITIVSYVRMIPPDTVFRRKRVVFESGAIIYLCDVQAKTSVVLCTVPMPSQGLSVEGKKIAGWLGDAFYVALTVNNEDDREVPFPYYEVRLSGMCTPIESLPADVIPAMNWNGEQYLFSEASDSLTVNSAITVMSEEGPDYSRRIKYKVGRARNWTPVFSLSNGSVDLKPL